MYIRVVSSVRPSAWLITKTIKLTSTNSGIWGLRLQFLNKFDYRCNVVVTTANQRQIKHYRFCSKQLILHDKLHIFYKFYMKVFGMINI
jgi:hypothetical protein